MKIYKEIFLGFIIVLVLAVIGYFVYAKKQKIQLSEPVATQSVALCYYYSKKTETGFFDRGWLRMGITESTVTGEYQNLPAEKDSKIGTFTGTVGPMDPKISARTADVWWNSMAEGMRVTEQLKIQFGEGSAVALFGEMIDRGDGTYVYKDSAQITPGFQMSQVDCESLQEMIAVEKYVRDNIQSIIVQKPALGGSWYVVYVQVNPVAKKVTVKYEDGHNSFEKTFSYTKTANVITVFNLEDIK